MLGEAGFGGEATVLMRALFETALALEFLLNGGGPETGGLRSRR
jgi:hypothetical protein